MSAPARPRGVRAPTLTEAVESVVGGAVGALRVSMPARVGAYDSITQTCSCQPVVAQPDGSRLPLLQGVPVVFPQGGGFSMTWPLDEGDYVLLQFSDRALEEWMARGDFRVPDDKRRFDISDAVAIPGLRPSRAPLPSTAASGSDVIIRSTDIAAPVEIRIDFFGVVSITAAEIHLGAEGLSTLLARADRVDAELDAIKTWANTHAHTGVTTGGGTSGTPAVNMSDPGPTASDKVYGD